MVSENRSSRLFLRFSKRITRCLLLRFITKIFKRYSNFEIDELEGWNCDFCEQHLLHQIDDDSNRRVVWEVAARYHPDNSFKEHRKLQQQLETRRKVSGGDILGPLYCFYPFQGSMIDSDFNAFNTDPWLLPYNLNYNLNESIREDWLLVGSIHKVRFGWLRDPEPFDWYQRFSGLKDIVTTHIDKANRILNVGSGNSRLSEEMFE